jgi:hypothetical protein
VSTTWRDRFRPLIAEVIERHGRDAPGLRAALRKAFPCPPRENHPYQIWLDEIRVQLGLRKFRKRKEPAPQQGQGELWG